MKILYYSPHPHLNLMSPSGYGTHMREMIKAFEKEGCNVLPVIMGGTDNPPEEKNAKKPSQGKDAVKKVIPKGIWRTLKDANLLRFDYATASKKLEQAVKSFDPDCIYERCYYLQLSGIRIAKKYRVTHILEMNSPYVEQNNYLSQSWSLLERYARHVEKRQVFDTNLPLATVGPLRDYFCKRYDADPNRFLITHDAFDEGNIQLDTKKQQQIKQRFQLNGQTVVGFIGSIFKWHGLDKLIKAFYELGVKDRKLLIVGYGEYMTQLIDLAEKLDIKDSVIFTGRVPKDEVFNYISTMDICAAPAAAWYQSPVKIFEYGAMGKPILGPDTAAVREVMEPNKDGILVEPTLVEVKKGLKALLENEEVRNEMGQHFQKKVLNNYTWQKNAQRVLDAVKNIQC